MPVNDVKRAGPNPHLVLTWVCMFSKTLLFATLLSLFQKQLHHESSDNPQSHPGSTSWSSCLSPIASWVHHRSQHLPALLWVIPAALFSVCSAAKVPLCAWDQRELQITPPVPRLALRITTDCTHLCLPSNKHLSVDPYDQEFGVPRWWRWVYK